MGLFTRIKNAFSPPREEYDDPVFGKLWREGKGLWTGEVPFQHPPTGALSMTLIIDSADGRPTDAQKQLYREVADRYAQLWPQIATKLAQYHPDLNTVDSITRHIEQPCLMLDPLSDGEPREWCIEYTFDLETEGDMGYSAEFREWQLLDIRAGD